MNGCRGAGLGWNRTGTVWLRLRVKWDCGLGEARRRRQGGAVHEDAESAPTQTLPPLVPGTLYLVATPIGNREDITLRALRVLRECTVVAAEDTRRTGQLLQHFGIRKPMVSYFHFNEARRSAEILGRLRAGETVALVTDAGTPGISDPGERVVAAAIGAGLRVEPVPGPCAAVAALTASGLPTETFHFAGFLPVKSGQRARRLGELLALPGTLCVYESPHRVGRLLAELAARAPGRRAVVAREVTKRFEEFLRGTTSALAAELDRRPRKGEFVVMLEPPDEGTSRGEPAGERGNDGTHDVPEIEGEPGGDVSLDSED